MSSDSSGRAYWRTTGGLLTKVLVIWLLVPFGAGLLLAGLLNRIKLGSYPLGFWFAHQGSVDVLIMLNLYYAYTMGQIDRRFDV